MASAEKIRNATKAFQSHVNNIKTQCDLITSDICTSVNINNIDDVQPADIKLCPKLHKEKLSDYLLSLANLSKSLYQCDYMCKYFNISDVSVPSDTDSQLATCRDTFAAVEKSLKQYDEDFKQKLSDSGKNADKNCQTFITKQDEFEKSINDKFDKLIDFIDSMSKPPPSPMYSNMPPAAPPAAVRLSTPETKPHIMQCVEDFISKEENSKLREFLSKVEFRKEKGHGVKNFGEPYRYAGAGDSSQARTEIPEIFNPVIKKISEEYPNCTINECLVNCYRTDSQISDHSDDEFEIDPESNIFCLSLGQERSIVFRDRASHVETTHVARDGSLYVMTRSSQDYFTHRIDQDSTSNGAVRYSLTFRHIGDRFKNSTIVIGDSNTTDLKFGEGFGTMGAKIPGKRVKAANVEDINPHDCAGFANVVIVTGTNNLRCENISSRADIVKIFQTLQQKISAIQGIRNNIKITIMPVLPTRFREMNRQIMCYNRMVYDKFVHAQTYFNIKMANLCEFLDREQLLRRDLSRRGDAIHLNDRGISVFVPCIKNLILNRIPRTFSQALTGDGKGIT